MTSRREQILAHVATTLATTAGIATVYRSRAEAEAEAQPAQR